MWAQKSTDDYLKRQKWYEKKRRRELLAVLDNADTVFQGLCEGILTPEQVTRLGFVHTEPQGVLAIDQKGGGKDLRQTRLYVYLDKTSKTFYSIILGDKDTQPNDIKLATSFVKELMAIKGEEHGKDEAIPERSRDGP